MEGGALFVSIGRTLFALIGVCALAFVVLQFLARRGVGVGRVDARLRLLERLPLSPRRQLYLVQADSRVFLLGAGDNGGVLLIAELGAVGAQPAPQELSDAGG